MLGELIKKIFKDPEGRPVYIKNGNWSPLWRQHMVRIQAAEGRWVERCYDSVGGFWFQLMDMCRKQAIIPDTLVLHRKDFFGRVVKTLYVGNTNYTELRAFVNDFDDLDKESPTGDHGRIWLSEVEKPVTSGISLLQWTWDKWAGVEDPIKVIQEKYPNITTSCAAFRHYTKWKKQKEEN
jgi:hypothetical protein